MFSLISLTGHPILIGGPIRHSRYITNVLLVIWFNQNSIYVIMWQCSIFNWLDKVIAFGGVGTSFHYLNLTPCTKNELTVRSILFFFAHFSKILPELFLQPSNTSTRSLASLSLMLQTTVGLHSLRGLCGALQLSIWMCLIYIRINSLIVW